MRISAVVLATALLMLPETKAYAGAWDDAWSAYQRGDFETALSGMLQLAEAGDMTAQDRLAHIYWYGEGTPIDYAEALRWSERSAAQGSFRGMNDLAAHYEHGNGVPVDLAKAFELYRKASAEGDGWSSRNAADMLAAGEGVDKNEAEALRLYREAAQQGDAGSYVRLGWAYLEGTLGLAADEEEALRLFQIAARKDFPAGQWQLSLMLGIGLGGEVDPVMSVMWYQLAVAARCLPPMPEALAAQLSQGQVVAGTVLADQWRDRHPREDTHPHPAAKLESCGEPLAASPDGVKTDLGV
jgi:TPR repeat protein